MAAESLIGHYQGRKRVREGRQDELSPTERKELEKSKSTAKLTLLATGTFKADLTEGQWKRAGERLICTPLRFGGQSIEEMQQQAASMGRVFSLGFLFKPFELIVQGDCLVTADAESIIYTEYCREG